MLRPVAYLLCLLISFGVTANAEDSNMLLWARKQKTAEANAVLELLKKKVAVYESVYKAVNSATNRADSLSVEQIQTLKNWSNSFQREYNEIHEKLLDKEDQIFRLDQKIEGEKNYRYFQVSNQRLQELGRIGSAFNKQRVDLHTHLESEIDEINSQTSLKNQNKPSSNSLWASISSLMAAPRITASTPLPQAAVPAPTPKAPAKVIPPIPAKKPAKAINGTKTKPPQPKRQVASVAPRKKMKTSVLASRLPAKLPIKNALPAKVLPAPVPVPAVTAEVAPPQVVEELPPPETIIAATPPPVEEPCPQLNAQIVNQFRDNSTDFGPIVSGLRELNLMTFKTSRTQTENEKRYTLYSKLFPNEFFADKIMQLKQKPSGEDLKRWKHLNYLARVKFIHLYESAIRASAASFEMQFVKGKARGKGFWSEKMFSEQQSTVAKMGFVGDSSCPALTSLTQAQGKCQLQVEIRFAEKYICNPNDLKLSGASFLYQFSYDKNSQRWILGELISPSSLKNQNGNSVVTKSPTFSEFAARAMRPKENVSTLESWIQEGLKSGDLIGFDEFLSAKRSEDEQTTAQKFANEEKKESDTIERDITSDETSEQDADDISNIKLDASPDSTEEELDVDAILD